MVIEREDCKETQWTILDKRHIYVLTEVVYIPVKAHWTVQQQYTPLLYIITQ